VGEKKIYEIYKRSKYIFFSSTFTFSSLSLLPNFKSSLEEEGDVSVVVVAAQVCFPDDDEDDDDDDDDDD
jgi:hypothetical protein